MLHIKKIKPLHTSIVTTAERYADDNKKGKLIMDSRATKGNIKWYQTVLEVGPMVRGIAVGDKVMLDASHFAVKRYSTDSIQNDMDNNPVLSYAIPVMTIDDEQGNPMEVLYIDERSIQFIFEGEERDDASIILPDTKIITN